jgi:hypothetical protein
MNAPHPAMAENSQGSLGGAMNGEVNVAKTFLAAASRLSTPDQGRVMKFMTKFMDNPAQPGLSLERVNNTADAGMWSARITQGLRAIIHRAGPRNTLLFAGQHDEAYHWAERRRLEHHPITGTLQIVETTESAEELLTTTPAQADSAGLFESFAEDYLLSLGVPADWLPTLRRVRFEDQVLTVVERLPEEVGERLLALASGEFVTPPAPVSPSLPLAENPDNLRRFWSSRMRRNSAMCSAGLCRTGSSFCILRSRSWSRGRFAERSKSRERRAPGRPWSRCIGPGIWPERGIGCS